MLYPGIQYFQMFAAHSGHYLKHVPFCNLYRCICVKKSNGDFSLGVKTTFIVSHRLSNGYQGFFKPSLTDINYYAKTGHIMHKYS